MAEEELGMTEQRRSARGAASEPVELNPGANVRAAAKDVEAEQWAWRRVKALRAFYTHLTIYALVNFVLMLIDIATPGGPWFFWPLLGWGLGLAMHAAQTFERLPWFTRDWEQRKVRELLNRDPHN